MVAYIFKSVLLFLAFIILIAPTSSMSRERYGMMFIKSGCFQMGNETSNGADDERPAHRVCLDDFWIDKYEVTQKDFSQMMGENPSRFRGCDNCPVETVSWYKAKAYCSFTGKRLPTEAEWEYAAREMGKRIEYGFGKNTISKRKSNYGWNKPIPVGGYRPNALGLYDMSGNVREWVSDWYDKEYYKKSRLKNPKGPPVGMSKALRGGYWGDTSQNMRTVDRYSGKPGDLHFANGFRCAIED